MVLFSSLPLALFDDLFHATSIGAMLRAASQINRIRASSRPFTLKEFVLSPEVADVFALYVSYQYLMSSGGNAYAGRVTAGGGTTFMISAGIKTREKLYSDIATGQFWWKDVFARPNPVKEDLRKEIDRQERILKQTAALDNVRDERIRQLINSEAIDRDLLISILQSPHENLASVVNARFQLNAAPFDYEAYNEALFKLRFDFVSITSVIPNPQEGIDYMNWGAYKAPEGRDPPTDQSFLDGLDEEEREQWMGVTYTDFLENEEKGLSPISLDSFLEYAKDFDRQVLELNFPPQAGNVQLTREGEILSMLGKADFEKLQAYARVFLGADGIQSPLVKTMIETIDKLKRQFEIVMDTILVHRE